MRKQKKNTNTQREFRWYENKTKIKQIELQEVGKKKNNINNQTVKMKKLKKACVYITNSCECMCELMHEIIWYRSMRYMKSIRKFNLLYLCHHFFPFHSEKWEIEWGYERCMHHLFSSRSSIWTFRKKLISFSIIKFGYWKKVRERRQTKSVFLCLCTYI